MNKAGNGGNCQVMNTGHFAQLVGQFIRRLKVESSVIVLVRPGVPFPSKVAKSVGVWASSCPISIGSPSGQTIAMCREVAVYIIGMVYIKDCGITLQI